MRLTTQVLANRHALQSPPILKQGGELLRHQTFPVRCPAALLALNRTQTLYQVLLLVIFARVKQHTILTLKIRVLSAQPECLILLLVIDVCPALKDPTVIMVSLTLAQRMATLFSMETLHLAALQELH